MKQFFYLFTLIFLTNFATSPVHAQNGGYIYGKIVTIDGKTFEGPLRWGKEEVFWTDIFNSSKEENDNLQYLTRDQRRELEERHQSFGEGFVNWIASSISYRMDEYDHTHQLVCQFGEIKTIKPFNRNKVEVTFQNGTKKEIKGEGYNDVGTDVKIIDAELGEISISWGRIEIIEFGEGNGKSASAFGEPLFGVVETYEGTFTGYIQWDHDERLSTDKLDGDTEDGELSIEFGNISSIEREGYNSSRIELKSGRDMDLRGTNDVNSENRGIVVTTEKLGRVDIPWKEFKKVEFLSKPSFPLKKYIDFKGQRQLEGLVVTTGGETIKGKIVYDLDEEYSYEMLQGKDNHLEYFIPFGNIKKIMPKNYDYSNVELKNGEKILLGERQDVSDHNTGVLVFKGGNDPIYVKWEDIKEVSFN
ncbi:hypothetical protein JMN32_18705 [Fulvivirga sp. 29W222]|uniref:DUF5666 domain-containing protein n=1 Tax=Fulvivirga marina TaxID=2494733 RepID=A0A937KCP5_9BACT|nr:hypothetical protein [Fulvivirga marina]MBL6448351.1 hypothetical protein [Fulvivirga marina]